MNETYEIIRILYGNGKKSQKVTMCDLNSFKDFSRSRLQLNR